MEQSTDPAWVAAHGPSLMAVVNLNTDSFSDPRATLDLDGRVVAAKAASAEGAAIIDLGAQSAALGAALVDGEAQAGLLVPIVSALHDRGIAVSVDTYEPVAARAVLAAGAQLLNDFSGAPDRGIVEAVAASGASYVLTHNPLGPRARQTNPSFYDDVVDDVLSFFTSTLRMLESWGLPPERVVLDPGVDVGKTPAQTLSLLRGRDRLRAELDAVLLWALGRKDIVGALTGRAPAARDAGTLALVAAFADHDRTVLRIHDTAGCRDLLTVHAALASDGNAADVLAPDVLLDDALRREG